MGKCGLFVVAVLLGACAPETMDAKRTQVAAIATCSDSQAKVDDVCENGRPLCDFDDDRGCAFCRCTTYAPLNTGAPTVTALVLGRDYYPVVAPPEAPR